MVAIEIPHEVAVFLNYVGVPYPDIDEDQVRTLADHVRRFATDLAGTHNAADTAVRELGAVYSGYSYQQLVATWARTSGTHMADLNQACAVVASALRAAAHVITVVKAAVLAELIALAASYAAALAASIATSGLSLAISEAIKQAARQLLKVMEQALIGCVLSEVVGKAIEPLEHLVERMVADAVHRGVVDVLDLPAPQTLYIEPDEVLRYAAKLDGYADDILRHAGDFADRVAGLTFRSGAAHPDSAGPHSVPSHTAGAQPRSLTAPGDRVVDARIPTADAPPRSADGTAVRGGVRDQGLPASAASRVNDSPPSTADKSQGFGTSAKGHAPQTISPPDHAGNAPAQAPAASVAAPRSTPDSGAPLSALPPSVPGPLSGEKPPWRPDGTLGASVPVPAGADNGGAVGPLDRVADDRASGPHDPRTDVGSPAASIDPVDRAAGARTSFPSPEDVPSGPGLSAEAPAAVGSPVIPPLTVPRAAKAPATNHGRTASVAPAQPAAQSSIERRAGAKARRAPRVAAPVMSPWSKQPVGAVESRSRKAKTSGSAGTPWSSPATTSADDPDGGSRPPQT